MIQCSRFCMYRVSSKTVPTWLFALLSASTHANCKSWLGHLWKIQEICYKIGTRILKIDLEIAEIIEVKVGTRQFWNWHFAITQHPKNNFGVAGANFDLNYLSYFWINFQNSCGYNVANFQGCWKMVKSSSVGAPEPEKLQKTKWAQ